MAEDINSGHFDYHFDIIIIIIIIFKLLLLFCTNHLKQKK